MSHCHWPSEITSCSSSFEYPTLWWPSDFIWSRFELPKSILLVLGNYPLVLLPKDIPTPKSERLLQNCTESLLLGAAKSRLQGIIRTRTKSYGRSRIGTLRRHCAGCPMGVATIRGSVFCVGFIDAGRSECSSRKCNKHIIKQLHSALFRLVKLWIASMMNVKTHRGW